MNLSEIKAQSHVLAGSPRMDGGRDEGLNAILVSVLRKLYLRAKMADQNTFVESVNWSPSSNDVELPEQSITPTSVSLVYDTDNDYRSPVRIVDLNEIDRYRLEGQEDCVAFYGNPQRARFTWNPNDDGDALVLWFERVQSDPTAPTSTPKLPADHHDLIAVETAILFREAVLNESVPQSLIADRRERMELFEKFCRGSREQRPVQRAPYSAGRGYY